MAILQYHIYKSSDLEWEIYFLWFCEDKCEVVSSSDEAANSEAGSVHFLRRTNADLGGWGEPNKLASSHDKTSGREHY